MDLENEKEKLNPKDNGWAINARSSQQFNVVRRVYQQDNLKRDADYHLPQRTTAHRVKKCIRKCGFLDCIGNSLPILRWLPKYKIKDYLIGDLVSGSTVAVMHIPQGMAYALLAEVPPIVGLYMAFFPVLIYMVLGTSPHVSMGTFAVACLMAGKVVLQHSTPNLSNINITNTNITGGLDPGGLGVPQYTPLQVLSVVCLTVGLMQMAMWILRLGAVSTLLSEPLVSGFTTAASIQVLASQLKDLFGLTLPKLNPMFKVIFTVVEVCKRLPTLNWAAFVISIIACLVIALNNEVLKPRVAKRCRLPVPIELIAIITGTLVSRFVDLKGRFGVSLVGKIPTGLPTPAVPNMELIPAVAIDAFTITMVTYTITMSMALIFASKDKYEVDANQELLALGASNCFGSFFGCAPFCASLSRSYIQYQTGAKTNLTSAVSASLIVCVLLWIGPFFEQLPRCVLASIIVVSLKGMFMQVLELAKFWTLSKLDALVWLITFLVTVLVNIDIGLACGLMTSLFSLFCRSQNPYTCLLGRLHNTDIYLDIKRYRGVEEIPGLKIFHYCGGLNFATKHIFRNSLFRKVGLNESTEEENTLSRGTKSFVWDSTMSNEVYCVIIDATALSYVDAPGVKMMVAVKRELEDSDIKVLFAGANAPVLEMIETYNATEKDGLYLETFPTVHDAVVYFKILEAQNRAKHDSNANENGQVAVNIK